MGRAFKWTKRFFIGFMGFLVFYFAFSWFTPVNIGQYGDYQFPLVEYTGRVPGVYNVVCRYAQTPVSIEHYTFKVVVNSTTIYSIDERNPGYPGFWTFFMKFVVSHPDRYPAPMAIPNALHASVYMPPTWCGFHIGTIRSASGIIIIDNKTIGTWYMTIEAKKWRRFDEQSWSSYWYRRRTTDTYS